jgi:hypothetical protein
MIHSEYVTNSLSTLMIDKANSSVFGSKQVKIKIKPEVNDRDIPGA